MKFIIFLLAVLCLIDLLAIIGGYLELPFQMYWLASADGFIPLFRDNLDILDRKVQLQRDFIMISVVFGLIWSLCSCSSAVYFRNRRYVASQWPLTLWKFTSVMLALRIMYTIWSMSKFHFSIMKDFMADIDGVEASFRELYANGTIGLIPAVLCASIFLNLFVSILSFLSIATTSDWRRLNISKRIY